MRKSWIKAEWDGVVFRTDDTMETLPGETMVWNGMTMVTKLGLRTTEITSCPTYPQDVPNARFLVTLTLSFPNSHSSVLKTHKNKEKF